MLKILACGSTNLSSSRSPRSPCRCRQCFPVQDIGWAASRGEAAATTAGAGGGGSAGTAVEIGYSDVVFLPYGSPRLDHSAGALHWWRRPFLYLLLLRCPSVQVPRRLLPPSAPHPSPGDIGEGRADCGV